MRIATECVLMPFRYRWTVARLTIAFRLIRSLQIRAGYRLRRRKSARAEARGSGGGRLEAYGPAAVDVDVAAAAPVDVAFLDLDPLMRVAVVRATTLMAVYVLDPLDALCVPVCRLDSAFSGDDPIAAVPDVAAASTVPVSLQDQDASPVPVVVMAVVRAYVVGVSIHMGHACPLRLVIIVIERDPAAGAPGTDQSDRRKRDQCSQTKSHDRFSLGFRLPHHPV